MKQHLKKLIHSFESGLLSIVSLHESGMTPIERHLFQKAQFPYHFEQEEAILLANIKDPQQRN